MWGSGPSDVYVYDGPPMHSTGNNQWTPITIYTIDAIMNVWGSSATDVYAVGDLTRLFHKGPSGTWTSTTPGWTSALWMSGSSATDLYVITATQLYHSTGNGTWKMQTVPLRSGEQMLRTWALSATAVYVTTYGSVLRSGGDGTWLAQIVEPNDPTLAVNQIWGTSPKNLYVATEKGDLFALDAHAVQQTRRASSTRNGRRFRNRPDLICRAWSKQPRRAN